MSFERLDFYKKAYAMRGVNPGWRIVCNGRSVGWVAAPLAQRKAYQFDWSKGYQQVNRLVGNLNAGGARREAALRELGA